MKLSASVKAVLLTATGGVLSYLIIKQIEKMSNERKTTSDY